MHKLSIFCLSLVCLLCSCRTHEERYFRRSLVENQEEAVFAAATGYDTPAAFTLPSDSLSIRELSDLFVEGSFYYYQGSPGHQLVLEEGLSLDPESALLHRELGVAYLKRGIADQFPRYYGKAASLDPVSWLGWRAYLYLYFYRDYQRAIDDCNRLDPLTPNFVDHPQSTSIDYMRGLAHHQLGEYQVARSYIDLHMEFERSSGDPQYIDKTSYLLSAMNYLELGKLNEALAELDTAVSWGSKWAELHYYRANILFELGRMTEARAALNKAEEGYNTGWGLSRPYVEEFFAAYPEDFRELSYQLDLLLGE
ncbi:MAG: tetratricopeptide repeat protein [Bacteroidota bacterium]